MSRLRRLVLSDRYFFVTCNRRRTRRELGEDDFAILARVLEARRAAHGFRLTAWVFLPDHWHAILGPRFPVTISRVLEAVKVGSTRRINAHSKEGGELWQGRFFDRALRTVKEYDEAVEYIHLNPVRRRLVARPEEWKWSSVHEYQPRGYTPPFGLPPLRVDRVRLPADERARI
jgi:putative transposase